MLACDDLFQTRGYAKMRFYKTDLELFQRIAESEIGIRRPVVLQVCKTIQLDGDYCVGLYEDLDDYHLIKLSRAEIWTPSELFATIVHEYIHAWQSENDLPVDHDADSQFPNWQQYILENYQVDIAGFNP